jgi:hypothetical protein
MTTNERTGYEHFTNEALHANRGQGNTGVDAEYDRRNSAPASWLTTAGYEANGGFVAPGTVRKPASTGKPAARKPRASKMTKIVDAPSATEPTRHGRPINPAKPITRGRIVGIGFYTYDDTVARVKISRSSGKPYAVVLDAATGEWVYTPGVVKNLSSDDVVSYEIAASFGRRTGRCMMCGRTLTNAESIDAGIGPICGGRLSRTDTHRSRRDDVDSTPATNAEIETSTVADNTTRIEDFDPEFDTAVRTVDGLIKSARNHPANPSDIASWVDLRNMVVANTAGSSDRMNDIADALTKWIGDLDALVDDRNADAALVAQMHADADYADANPVHPTVVSTGPVMRNGRLDHTPCDHPRTPAGRAACRKFLGR